MGLFSGTYWIPSRLSMERLAASYRRLSRNGNLLVFVLSKGEIGQKRLAELNVIFDGSNLFQPPRRQEVTELYALTVEALHLGYGRKAPVNQLTIAAMTTFVDLLPKLIERESPRPWKPFVECDQQPIEFPQIVSIDAVVRELKNRHPSIEVGGVK